MTQRRKKEHDFLERLVRDAIGNQYGIPAMSPILGASNSIAITPSPSNNYEHYYDGSYRQGYAFQVLVKHENQLDAYMLTQKITMDLSNKEDIPSGDGTYTFEGVTITTDANMIGQDGKHFVFGAQMSAALYIK